MTDLVKQTCRCGRDFRGNLKALIERGFKEGRCRRCVKLAARKQGVIFFRKQALKLKKEKQLMDYIKTIILGSLLLLLPTLAKGADWRLETHFMIDRDQPGAKVLGASLERKLWNIFGGYGELDLMPDADIFSSPRFSGELGVKARVEASCGLYLGAGTGLALMTSTGEGLATKWQLPTTIEGGLYNDLGSIGFMFKHYSNGTSNYKNSGRNYIGFQIGHSF